MCKNRIEKVALKFEGITVANWTSKILEFKTSKKINKTELEKVIAKLAMKLLILKKIQRHIITSQSVVNINSKWRLFY